MVLIGLTAVAGYSAFQVGGVAEKSKDSRYRFAGKGDVHRSSVGTFQRCTSKVEAAYTRCEPPVDASDYTVPVVHTADAAQGGLPVKWYSAPVDSGVSMWHHVDLHVKTWLDEDTGLFRYVNEIPRGALQKFELQTKLAHNVIREDDRGSRKLRSFGKPVPFNYGCFPQTFRDPQETDDIFHAPGDDDPLDVLDLTPEASGVGEVVCCRPLGAVCLIDEGQADWKIIVVNADAKGPLAAARSIEEAERIAPGRIEEALRWMDDFKQHSSKSESTLHYEIHDAARAISIIQRDHAAWSRLVAEADAAGIARGHWICPPQKQGRPQVVPLGLTPQIAASCKVNMKSALAGSSFSSAVQQSYAAGRALTLRRQTSATSDGGDSSSGLSDFSPHSSDTEMGA